ncbi:MAG: UDP-N-acetylmuramate--L-alanine ligase [Traorella sp.]
MVHFIGIKGSGMASLACILYDMGENVKGSDIEKFIFTQKPLEERNIQITSFDESNINEDETIIIGNAFDETNPEVKKAKSLKNGKVYYYHEYLGKLVDQYVSISIAGCHGKTTTTSMMAHMLEAVAPTGFLIGDGSGDMPNNAKYFVLESCEYKRHFMAYHPDYAIITSIDLDHVDYYKDLDDYKQAFIDFASQVKKKVIVFGDDKNIQQMDFKKEVFTYGMEDHNDVQAINFVENENGMSFDVLIHHQLFGHFEFPYVGIHLCWNSLSIIALGYLEGIQADVIQKQLSTFKGAKRRFAIETKGSQTYIDDYAHHPTAIKLTIEAARVKFPTKKIVAIFKPDRYSRVNGFMNEFASSLMSADEVILCPFPENAVREAGIDIDIYDLARLIPGCRVMEENDENARLLSKEENVVYLFMSSKDIYKWKDKVKNFHNA